MIACCPQCGSHNVRSSEVHGLLEQLGRLFGYVPLRCRDCDKRFSFALHDIRNSIYARCPRCYRLDLSRWEPDHYRVTLFSRLMLRVGAKAHRCQACRCNFVSFRPAKMRYTRIHHSNGVL